jgi:calcium-dependent protein kinase
MNGHIGECLECRMLARDPASRITTEEALRHPWLSDTSLAQCAPLHRSISMRLRSFTRLQRLKRLLLNIVAQRLSRQQIRDLHNLFVALVSHECRPGFV